MTIPFRLIRFKHFSIFNSNYYIHHMGSWLGWLQFSHEFSANVSNRPCVWGTKHKTNSNKALAREEEVAQWKIKYIEKDAASSEKVTIFGLQKPEFSVPLETWWTKERVQNRLQAAFNTVCVWAGQAA